jgi:VCBS repeat protein
MADGRGSLVLVLTVAGALLPAGVATAHVQFSERVIGAVSGSASDVAVARLNADRRPDVAVAVVRGILESGGVQLAASRHWSGWQFGPFVMGGQTPYRVAAGDIDGDRDVDLVQPNTVSGDLTVFANNGAGALALAETIPAGQLTRGIALADLNGDHRLDLATSSIDDPELSGPASLRVHYRAPDNSGFEPAVVVPHANPDEFFAPVETLAAADLNADGARDLVGVEQTRVLVSYRSPDGTSFEPVQTAAQLPGGPFDVATGDLNRDGLQDLVTGNLFASYVTVLLRRSDNTGFEAPRNFEVGGGSTHVAISDFDRDGRQDIAASLLDVGRVAVIRGARGDGFGPPRLFEAGAVPLSLAAADMDSDGDPDLVVGDRDSGEVRVLVNRRRFSALWYWLHRMRGKEHVRAGESARP